MQFRYVLSFLTAVALAQLAQAQPPSNAHELGAAQAVFDFCSKVDPADAKLFDKQSKRLFQGLSEKSVDQVQMSHPYTDAHKTLESVLSELPLDAARAACKAIG